MELENGHKSKDIVPKSLDKAMDKANPDAENAAPGISIRNGPLVEMDVDEPEIKGLETNGKRKSRHSHAKSYKESSDEDDEDDKPLVCSDVWAPKLDYLTCHRANGGVCPKPTSNPIRTPMTLRLFLRQLKANPHY